MEWAAVRGKETFNGPEFFRLKEKFLETYKDVFPSGYWRHVLDITFDDKWFNSPLWSFPSIEPEEIDFTFDGVKVGPDTFASSEMLEVKRKFFDAHKAVFNINSCYRKLSIAFDEVWYGEKLNSASDVYTPVEETRIRKLLFSKGFKYCGCGKLHS